MHARPAGVSYPTDNQRTNTLNETEKGWEVSEGGTLGDTSVLQRSIDPNWGSLLLCG